MMAIGPLILFLMPGFLALPMPLQHAVFTLGALI